MTDILKSIAKAKKQMEDAREYDEPYRVLYPHEENGKYGREYWEGLGYKVVITKPLPG